MTQAGGTYYIGARLLLLSKLPTARFRSGPGGEEDLKAVGGCEGQVAAYFLLRWVTKNMKIRKNCLPIVQTQMQFLGSTPWHHWLQVDA